MNNNINQSEFNDFHDLNDIQITTNEQYLLFRQKYLANNNNYEDANINNQNVGVLISAIVSNCSPEFFIFATSELNMYFQYFQDYGVTSNILLQDIYDIIEIILKTSFLNKAKNILNDWQTALNYQQYQTNQLSYFSDIIKEKPQLARSYFIGCLQILCGISRGNEIHSSFFEQISLFELLFDIFDATKTERDIAEIMIYMIGNIGATKDSWRLYFMQKDFPIILLEQLKYTPKNYENMILHRKICWSLNQFTKDDFICSQDKVNQQSQSGQTEFVDSSIIDFFNIKYLFDTFIYYNDPEIRTDILWTFSQLIAIVFKRVKCHPQLINHTVKNKDGVDVLNIEGNIQLLQIQKQLISDSIGFLIQNGLCEYVNAVFPISDMSFLVPTLRAINRILGANQEILEVFFQKCNETISQNISIYLQSTISIIRRESVKTLHCMFQGELEGLKGIWFMRFMPIILTRFNNESYSIKEEVLKLLNSIINKLNPEAFDVFTFDLNSKFCIFKTMRNILQSQETNKEGLISIISIFTKMLNFYKVGNSNSENQKMKRIMQILDSNNIAQLIEGFQENSIQEICQHSVDFFEIYNNIQQRMISEYQREQSDFGQ